MKKLCVLFCLFFCIPVSALEYSSVPCQSVNDLVQIERRYKWYQIENHSLYFREGENIEEDYIVDPTQSKKTQFSEWSYEEPEPFPHRNIEKRTIYAYQEINPIQYLYLFSLTGSHNKLYISEIELHDNGEKVPFQITCTTCSKDFVQKVTDHNYQEGGYAFPDSIIEIKIEPKKYHYLNLHIRLHDEGTAMKKIELRATYERDIEDIYYDYASQHYFTHTHPEETEEVIIPFDRLRKRFPKYGDEKISLEPLTATEERKVEQKNQYRYQDTLFQYHKTYRKYISDYKVHMDHAIRDEKLYKDYYLCMTKDVLKEKLRQDPLHSIHPTQTISSLLKTKQMKQNICPSPDERYKKDFLQCKKEKKITFFWILLFFLCILLHELYQKYSHKK